MEPGSIDPYAPPKADVVPERERRPADITLAGLAQRFLAAGLDGLLQRGCLEGVGWLLREYLVWEPERPPGQLAHTALTWVPYVAIHVFFVLQFRASVGKLIFGMRMVRSSGAEASAGRLLLARPSLLTTLTVCDELAATFVTQPRLVELVGIVTGLIVIFDVIQIFGSKRQCLHDRIADTIVIDARAARRASRAPLRGRRSTAPAAPVAR